VTDTPRRVVLVVVQMEVVEVVVLVEMVVSLLVDNKTLVSRLKRIVHLKKHTMDRWWGCDLAVWLGRGRRAVHITKGDPEKWLPKSIMLGLTTVTSESITSSLISLKFLRVNLMFWIIV
jgi:hypothetical protein